LDGTFWRKTKNTIQNRLPFKVCVLNDKDANLKAANKGLELSITHVHGHSDSKREREKRKEKKKISVAQTI
jgi:hypothetical protein